MGESFPLGGNKKGVSGILLEDNPFPSPVSCEIHPKLR